MRVLRNWPEAVAACWTGKPLECVKLRNGAVLRGPRTQGFSFLFHEIWINRVYSPAGYEIRDRDLVIDIGANIGLFSAYAAMSARDVCVDCYEPYAGCVEWLRSNIESSRLSKVAVYQQAVAGSRGTRTLKVNAANWIVNSLADDALGGEGVQVDCVTLDDVMDRSQRDVCDLLKLDCEGSEYEILRGCRKDTLKRVKKIVGEYHDLGGPEASGASLRELLESRDFVIDRLEPFPQGGGMFCARNVALSTPDSGLRQGNRKKVAWA
jgi:FkbM family methyltransferase